MNLFPVYAYRDAEYIILYEGLMKIDTVNSSEWVPCVVYTPRGSRQTKPKIYVRASVDFDAKFVLLPSAEI